jgi:hypothetical protein
MDKPVSQMTPNEHVRYMQEQHDRISTDHSQRFEATMAPFRSSTTSSSATAMPPRSNGQPYFTPGGFHDAKSDAIAGVFAPVAACLFMAAARELVKQGHPQGSATYGRAMLHALHMVWLWKTWAFSILYWVVSGVCIWLWKGSISMTGDPATGYTTGLDSSFQTKLLVLHVALLLPAILIPYCQHVDASFFQKRVLYHVLSPIHKAIGWMPWFVLQSTVLLPLLFIIQYRW